MDSVWQDLRYAVRNFLKSPGFAVVAVLTVAIAIGANTAVFGVVKQVLLRPFGLRNPDQVVMLWPRNLARNIPMDLTSPALYQDWRAQNRIFSEMAAATDRTFTLTGAGEPLSAPAWRVSANFMHVLGAEPLLGRNFTTDEEQPARSQVVLLSYTIWQRQFGGDPSVVGRLITLDERPYTVVGVMPREFRFPSDVTQMWTPLVLPPGAGADRGFKVLRVVARIKDGVALSHVEQEMQQLSARLAQQYPDTDRGWDVRLQSAQDMFVGDIRGPLLAIMGAVVLVLLIACANIANLLLARATGRQREIAVRVTLGASRARIIRQLLTESVLLAVAGGALGLLVALWARGLLVHLFPNDVANLAIPRVEEIPLDATVIGFSVAMAILTGVLFGAAAALQVSAIAPGAGLKEEGARSTAGGASRRLRSTLVAAQVALALVLLISAGLMIRSSVQLQNVNLGFNPDHLLTMYTSLPQSRYPADTDSRRFVQEAEARIRTVPGVQSVGTVNFLPLTGYWGTLPFKVPGMPAAPVAQWPSADYRTVSADYFRTMQIPVLRGRAFSPQDSLQSPLVCIVNATFARQFLPGQDPVGKSLTARSGDDRQQQWSIIGVVGDVKHFGPAESVHAELYRPFTQEGFPFFAFTVRTGREPMALADPVRHAIWSVDKALAITRVLSMDEAAAQSSALRRVSTLIFGFFAFSALALAALGIYGVVSYLTVRRTREVGIRMALGAQTGDILRLIVGQSFLIAGIGLVVGVVVALMVTRFLSSLLFEVRATDPLTFAAVAILLCSIALVAAWLPARRAARLDPLKALHYE